MDDISALRIRLAHSTGPDRILDGALARVCNYRRRPLPEFTGSIDAAETLFDELRPGWRKQFFENKEMGWSVSLISPENEFVVPKELEFRPTPALALLSALLHALETRLANLSPA